MLLAPFAASAHDIQLPVDELVRGVSRVRKTVDHFKRAPAIPGLPETEDDQRRVLGAAEIELALGNRTRALEMLMGRLADPRFVKMKEYVSTLLFTSEILESSDEHVGAMHYAELALTNGGTPDQMAEAGARWFRLARRHQRLARRLEIYELWRSKGGERAADIEVGAQVAYEVAFALRADGRREDARALLSKVASESTVGSRAAYLAGVIFVEGGDLANGERWFSAVMDWPLPDLSASDPQMLVEKEVRELSALSAARLRYERGDLEAADLAYATIPFGSPHELEACWERAYLDLTRGRRRGALQNLQCVSDLGAGGAQHVDVRLFRASLLAHVSRYSDSIEAYTLLHKDMERERDLFKAAVADIRGPAEFLFDAMERSSVRRGKNATPGPATLFRDAWSPSVDQAYRIDRGGEHTRVEAADMMAEIDALAERLSHDDAFVVLDIRRANLERLLREIHHLLGHAGEEAAGVRARHAGGNGAPLYAAVAEHSDDLAKLAAVTSELQRMEKEVEAQLTALSRIERERRGTALTLLKELRVELVDIMRGVEALESDAGPAASLVAKEAIRAVEAALQNAALRAEAGVLDTYWLKKDHRTQAIESLLDRKKEAETQANEAMMDAELEQQEYEVEVTEP
jgi:hypothetical protein